MAELRARQSGIRRTSTVYGLLPAMAYLAAGELADAMGDAERGLALAVEHGARAREAPLLRVRAEILAAQHGDAAEALSSWNRSLEIASELGMRPETGFCHLGLARFHRTRDRATVRTHAECAVATFTDLDMPSWRDEAEALLEG